VILDGDLTVTNLFTIYANKQVTLDGYMGSAVVYCQGGLNVYGDDSILGTALIHLTGTGTWLCAISQFDCDVVINTSGTITLNNASDIVIGGNFTYIAGTVVATGTTVQINGAGKNFDSNGIAWNNITIPPPGSGPMLLSDLQIGGNFTCGRGTNFGTYIITLNGNFTDSNTDGTQIISGNCTWVFDGNTTFASTSGYHPIFYNVAINAGKTVKLISGATINVTNVFTAAGTAASHIVLQSITATSSATFKPVVLGTVSYVDATDIDSTGVGKIVTVGGSLTRTTNWGLSAVLKKNQLERTLVQTVNGVAAADVKTISGVAFQ
jgi:hypothetical protein